MLIPCPRCGTRLLRVARAEDADGYIACAPIRERRPGAPPAAGTKVRYRGTVAEIVHASDTRLRLRLPSPGTRTVEIPESEKRLKDGTKKVIPARTFETVIAGQEFDIAPDSELEVIS